MPTTTKLVTYEEWLSMPETGDAIEEVVNGELKVMPPPKVKHTLVVHALRRIIERQLNTESIYVLDTLFGLVVRRDPLTTRVPDLAIFRKESMVVVDDYIRSAPDLAVEVLSPSNTRSERESKLSDYASLGVPEAWVLSPEARTVEVLLLENGKLQTVHTLREGQ